MSDSDFRFRLERVRALRERKEEIAKQQLAHALSRLLANEERLREVEDQLAAALDGQRGAADSSDSLSAQDLIARQAFVERVEQQRRQGTHEVKRSEHDVANRGAALTDAAQEHQMLERLKERHRAAHLRELARREGETLDEIALDRFRRNVA